MTMQVGAGFSAESLKNLKQVGSQNLKEKSPVKEKNFEANKTAGLGAIGIAASVQDWDHLDNGNKPAIKQIGFALENDNGLA